MKKLILGALSLLFIVVASSEMTYARSSKQPSIPQSHHSSQSYSRPGGSYNGRPVTVVKSYKPKVVNRLPPSKYSVRHNGVDYYRNGSKYYRRVDNRYVLVPLPFGIRVPFIPAIHTIFRYDRVNYYCADGVVYRESGNDYVVVEPQVGMVVPELPMYNVNQVNIDGMICFEFDGILYQQIPTVSGIQYKVIGTLNY